MRKRELETRLQMGRAANVSILRGRGGGWSLATRLRRQLKQVETATVL